MTYKAPIATLALPAPYAPKRPKPQITPSLARLLSMLRFKRPYDGFGEKLFIRKFIDPVEGMQKDAFGNRWVTVGDSPHILWSCHTDTVHHESGLQKVYLDGPFAKAAKSDALGADDTAGVWLMLEMIDAGVPGLYVFHRGEEVGGLGSRWISKHGADQLKGIRCAIALDRKGYTSVITHQGHRTCSDAFAASLAAILGGEYEPDDTGLFTDTANYTDLIGECTNLSVGYFGAHGAGESLDLEFIAGLRDTLIAADFSSLVYSREAGDYDESAWGSYYDRYYGGGYSGDYHDHSHSHGSKSHNGALWRGQQDSGWRTVPKSGVPLAAQPSLIDFVKANPERVADMLEHDGWDVHALADYLGVDVDADEYA